MNRQVPEVMLAVDSMGKYPVEHYINKGYIIQEKLDGVRALIAHLGGVTRVYGRGQSQVKDENGKKIIDPLTGAAKTERTEFTDRVPEITDYFAGYPHDFIIDVELLSTDFNGAQSKVGTKKFVKYDPNFYFSAFDMIHWGARDFISAKKPMNVRWAELTRFRESVFTHKQEINDTFFRLVQDYGPIKSQEHLDSIVAEIVSRKGEGVIIKDPEGHYVPEKRTQAWIKVLPHNEMDVVFLKAFEGQGKYKGMMGGLEATSLAEWEKFKGDESLLQIKFNVGTGFDEEQRRLLWTDSYIQLPALGKITYKNIIEKSGIPRMPVFQGFKEGEVE